MEPEPKADMKLRVARTIKWNIIDKFLTQALYGVTGVILANLLSESDFGLVGAILVFQAFATLFVDSGFSYALIQRKQPTELDYSTVFWFNLSMSALVYIVLAVGAPFIAECFQNDERLIPLARVMFLTFILNASAIVQTNRLMKRMEVKMIAVSNSVGLISGAVVGIFLAISGYGAWAIVWQSVALAATKSLVLWLTSGWHPMMAFSFSSLRSFFRFGSGVMFTSFLNVLFQNIYGFFIGNRAGMVSMGYYYQADKWSKMGVASLSSVVTSSFLPALSQYQNDPQMYAASTAKMNRFTAYVLFPAIGMLMAVSHPLFHSLFGTKWDPAVILFQLLLAKGIFTVLSTLYHSYIMALGRSRLMIYMEALRDVAAIIAIVITLPYITLSSADNLTEGISLFLWGQVLSSALTWAVTLVITARISWRTSGGFLYDLLPYLAETIIAVVAMLSLKLLIENSWLLMFAQLATGLVVYIGLNRLLNSRIQSDVWQYLTKKKTTVNPR